MSAPACAESVLRSVRSTVVVLAVVFALCVACGADDASDSIATTSPTDGSTDALIPVDGVGPDGEDDVGESVRPRFEFVITDIFTPEDGDSVILVGYLDRGSLRPGDIVETFTVGPESRGTVVQIDRVTPSPLTRDVGQLLEGETANVEISGPVADDYIKGQTIIPAEP